MKILVLGRAGQLAQAWSRVAHGRAQYTFSGHEDFDLYRVRELPAYLERLAPDLIINTAAFTAVDKAETQSQEAHVLNAEVPAALAQWCEHESRTLVHFSTDYVFSGAGSRPWRESDEPAPMNVYGRTKWEGEKAITRTRARHFIFRTSWVYDETGLNFLKTMLRLADAKPPGGIKVVADQWGAPTWAEDLARFVEARLADMHAGTKPSGIYHLSAAGETNWADFARFVFKSVARLRPGFEIPEVRDLTSAEYPTPARRPHNSRLDHSRTTEIWGDSLPAWPTGVEACLQRIYGNF
jgi:dTDP-4-dehydrorhamnose reductase